MANPYDDIVAQSAPAPSESANPYDAVVGDAVAERQQRTRTVFEKALATNPDQAAENKRLADSTGLPTDIVERNRDEIKRKEQARLLDLARMAQDSPVLARQLMDPTFTTQAHDDVGTLGQVEQFFRDSGNSVKAGVYNANKGAAGVFRAGFEFAAPALDVLEPVTAIGGNPLRRLAEGFAAVGDAADKSAKAVAPKTEGNISGGVQSGIQSLTQNLLALPLAFLPGGEAAALGMMSATTGGQSYQDARAKGLSMSQALPFAASQAAIEYATERIPLGDLVKDLKIGSPVVKLVTNQLKGEVIGEQIATVLQDMNEWAVLNPEKPFRDYIAERPDAAAQTLIATLVGTGGNIAVAKGIESATRQLMGDAYDAGLAEQGAGQLQTALQTAAASKLRERNPDEFRSLMQGMVDNTDGAPAEVFVDAEVLNQLAPELMAQLPQSVRDALPDALAANDVVSIPVADVLTIAPGTPLEQMLIENARIGDAGAMSQAEAKVAGEQAQQYLAQEAQRVIAQATDAQAMQESSDRVKQGIFDQLQTTGRFRRDVNDAYATWTAAFYTTMGGRLGLTPEEMAAKYPLKIAGQSGQASAALNAMEQTQTPEFKNWFGESKVVDASGKPLVVYHGTNQNIDKFDPARIGSRDAGFFGTGFYFTPDEDVASEYADTAVEDTGEGEATAMPLYVALKNPFVWDMSDEGADATRAALAAAGIKRTDVRGNSASLGNAKEREVFNRLVREQGHDGVVVRDEDGVQEVVAFSPTQIKSAIGNNGNFDPNDPNILKQSLPSRWPTSKKVTPSVNDPMLADLETLRQDPEQFEKAVAALSKEAGMRTKPRKPEAKLQEMLTKMVDNLLWLHDQVPAEIRQRSKLWYDGARNIADSWVLKYGKTRMQTAGILAVLSPQKDWFVNVTMGERVLDILSTQMDHSFDDKMRASAFQFLLKDLNKPEDKRANTRAFETVKDKTLRQAIEAGDTLAIGIWMRAYDEAYHSGRYAIIRPEGDFAESVTKDDGENTSRNWGGFDAIGKAASIFLDGSAENVSKMLGGEHKVRNFYNNIYEPTDGRFATIDTHAVAAALLRPLAGTDKPVTDNFGGTGGTNTTGVSGTYPIYFEAYKRAAEARGILPREMQSITWEAVRGLYTDTFKTAENKDKVEAIWRQVDQGKLSIDDARAQALELAGGMLHPTWWNGAEAQAPAVADKTYDQEREPFVGRKVTFEVAPDPNNAELTVRWNALPAEVRLQISKDLGWFAAGRTLAHYNSDTIKGELHLQTGGYLENTNPSLSLWMNKYASMVKIQEIARILGYVLDQDSMMVTSPKAFKGGSENGAVVVHGVDAATAKSVYDELRANVLAEDGAPLVQGHTTGGNAMVILVTAADRAGIAQKIAEHLGDRHDVTTDTLFAEWPEKGDDGYGISGREAARGSRAGSPLRKFADQLRSETARQLEQRIDDAEQRSAAGVFEQSDAGTGRSGPLRAADLGTVTARYGVAQPNAVSVLGVHYSRRPRTSLTGSAHGTGLKGAEAKRLEATDDERLRNRVHFYVDEGQGIRPEAGVGGYVHAVNLDNLYDVNADPLGLKVGQRATHGDNWFNGAESAILDAGFDGVYVPGAQGNQGVAVLLGPQHTGVPVEQHGTHARAATGAYTPPAAGPRKFSLMSDEMDAFEAQKAEIKAAAPSARVDMGSLLFDEADTAAVAQFFPGIAKKYAQGPRGTFSPANLELALNENADLSTFLHETGHFFLEVMADLSSQPGAPAEIQADMAALLKWFGVENLETWNGYTLEQKRPYHERFAESFEQYLLEGKAPSVELQPLFRKFSAWLKQVYRSLKAFVDGNQASTIQLSPEVRQVFDRMLASEDQIAEAEKVAGLLPDVNPTAEAVEKLTARSLRDLKWTVNARAKEIKKLQKQAAELRKGVEAEVRAEVEAQPIYAALKFMRADTKLSIDGLESLYAGEGDRYALLDWSPLVSLKLAGKEGAHPDIIADMFGYPSGDALVRAALSAEPISSVIEGMTDQRMLEEHGDLIDDRAIEQAANEAIHNAARAKSLATELKAQADALNPRAETGETNAKGQKITVNALTAAAKQFADNVIARTPLRDLKAKAWQHTAAERRAAKRWQEATAKAQTQDAVKAKQDQMLNHATARAAMDAQGEMRKMIEFFRRVVKDGNEKTVEKGRDPDVVNAARAILGAYGIAPAGAKTALEYMALVEKNDPAMFAALQPSMQAALNMAQPLDALTMEELRGLHEEIQGMWHLAKRSRQMEVDGNLMDMEDAESELQTRMQEIGVPDTMPGDTGAVTKREEFARKLQHAGSLLRRTEQWAEGMGSEFTKLVFRPVKAAADQYRTDRVKYRKAYQALVDQVAPFMPRGTIAAPELGYTFGQGHNGIGMAELLHAILHTGNDSNKRKLLLGRKWATQNADGTLDTSKWDSFVTRLIDEGTLQKEHFDFAQGVWDLLEQTKPLAQKTHRDVFGRYFAEVTANEFTTPFGTYRGGYVPAQADPRIVQDADLRKLAESENENMAFAFPATNKGFTKGRVEYNRPLLLDLRTIGQHIDKVLLFSHMESAVRDVNRLLSRKGVAYSLGRIDPTIYSGMLTPWLNRSAKQIVETPIVGDGGISRVLSTLRARAGMSLMFANVSNTLQQVTGFSTAFAKLKADGLESHMLRSTAQFIAHPKQMAKDVAEASPFMANRMENEIASINDVIDQILLDPNLYQKSQAWFRKHAYFMQSAFDNTMGPIIWTAAYNGHLTKHGEEKAAVQYADSVIRQTQGSTLPEDVSRLETGPAYARMFTQFVGYFNMMANTNATALKQIAQEEGFKKGAGKALLVVTFGMLVPIWIAEAIAVVMRGGPGDDDKDGYLDDWLAAVFGMGTIKGSFAMVPFVGQLANAAINRMNKNPADDKMSLSPAVSLLESAVGVPSDVYKALTDPDKLSKRNAVRDVASAVSLATGLPATAIARPLGYLAGMNDGRIRPANDADQLRGLITGSASPESR